MSRYRVTVSWAMGFLREGYADDLVTAQEMAERFKKETGKPASIEEATRGLAGWLYRIIEGE